MIAARNPLPRAQSAIPAVDPFLALIEAHRAAYLAWDAASDVVTDFAPGDAGRAEAERAILDAGERHRAAFDALAGTPPIEPVHLVRLAEHLRWFYAQEFDGRGHAGLGLMLGGIEALSPALAAASEPSPALAALVAEWTALEAAIASRATSDDEAEALTDGGLAVQRRIYGFPAASLVDLRAKVPALRDVMEAEDADSLPGVAWRGLIADIERLSSPGAVLPLATAAGPDPALAAIAASRAAEAAVIAFHARDDDEPMDPAKFDEEKRLCAAQVATRETAWKTPPTTQAGRRALVEFARFQVERHTGHTGKLDAEYVLPEILDAMAAMVEAENAAAAPGPDAEALALVDAIEREWSASAHLLDASSPDGEATDAALARRKALLDAADRLPATSRGARHAKAMALGWIMAADLLEQETPCEAYGTDGRLAFDIAASLMKASTATEAGR